MVLLRSTRNPQRTAKSTLGAPIRMITLEDVSLFEDRAFKVVPAGTGFAIMSVRDARVDDKIFATADAAKAEILRRQPVQVVS